MSSLVLGKMAEDELFDLPRGGRAAFKRTRNVGSFDRMSVDRSVSCNFNKRLNRLLELGMRQYCRDNETMFSGHKVVCYCNFTTFGVATPSRHRDLNIFQFFSGSCGSITLSRCCCREAIKLSRAQLCKLLTQVCPST